MGTGADGWKGQAHPGAWISVPFAVSALSALPPWKSGLIPQAKSPSVQLKQYTLLWTLLALLGTVCFLRCACIPSAPPPFCCLPSLVAWQGWTFLFPWTMSYSKLQGSSVPSASPSPLVTWFYCIAAYGCLEHVTPSWCEQVVGL